MRIKTGETATVGLRVDLAYRCSACGKANLSTQTIAASASTPTILGINLDSNLYGSAREKLKDKISKLSNTRNPRRFRKAGFGCICDNCGHREPWANMRYRHLSKPLTYSLVVMFFSGFYFHNFYNSDIPAKNLIISGIILLLSTALSIGIICYVCSDIWKKERQIAALPPESIPRILPYIPELHSIVRKNPTPPSKKEISYDTWACKKCGTENSMQYSQCKKCGQSKFSQIS